MSNWFQQQAKIILKDAKARYGAGWELMSADQRKNYLDSRILNLIMTQELIEYGPAQVLAIGVNDQLQVLL